MMLIVGDAISFKSPNSNVSNESATSYLMHNNIFYT